MLVNVSASNNPWIYIECQHQQIGVIISKSEAFLLSDNISNN